MSDLTETFEAFLSSAVNMIFTVSLSTIAIVIGIICTIVHLARKHSSEQNQIGANPQNAGGVATVAPQNSNMAPVAQTNVASTAPTMQATPNAVPVATVPKKMNPYTKYNILLICGSVFIVFAIVSFMNTVDSTLVAPTVIALTLLFYALGVAIYKTIDYLKPVGLTFIYTATAVFPFWVIALCSCGIDVQSAWIICSIISFAAFTGTAILTRTKILPFLSYLWLLVIAWACTPSGNSTLRNYWIYLVPIVMSFVPILLYYLRPTWLPRNFRLATKVSAFGLYPILFFWSLSLYFLPNAAISMPILRTLIALSAVIYALVFWSKECKHGWLMACRFTMQGLLCACVADIINFSIFDEFSTTAPIYNNGYNWLNLTSDSAKFIICTVWVVSCLAQALVSLYSSKKSKRIAKIEQAAEIIALIGIFITPALLASCNNKTGIGIVSLIVDLALVALGIAYTKFNKNILWGIATLIGAALIPSALSTGLIDTWSNQENLLYYALYGALTLLAYSYLYKRQPKETEALTVISLIVASLIVLICACDLGYPELGWLIISLFLAGFGYLRKSPNLLEASIYGASLCLYSLIGTLMDTTASPDYYERLSYSRRVTALDAVRCYIIPAALLGVSYWRERNIKTDSSRWRLILGYIILSLSLIVLGTGGNSEWLLLSAVTQVGFLVFAAMTSRDWLIWSSIIIIVINMLTVTGSFTWMGFAVIGIALIGIVIWQMSKQNKAKRSEELERSKKDSDKAAGKSKKS